MMPEPSVSARRVEDYRLFEFFSLEPTITTNPTVLKCKKAAVWAVEAGEGMTEISPVVREGCLTCRARKVRHLCRART